MPRPRRSEDAIVEIARLRYEQRLAQHEIARKLGISEATVSRSLKAALDYGYVEIMVAPKAFRDAELERDLRQRFGLVNAVVVESRPSPAQTLEALGKATARALEELLKPGDVLGVSDGATVAAIAAATRRLPSADIDVVALVGGVGAPEHFTHSSEVCRRMAAGLGARAWQLPAPAIVDDDDAARMLRDIASIRGVFAMMGRIAIGIVGIGFISANATVFREGFVEAAALERIRARGAVGTICARFYGKDGQPVGSDFDGRTQSIALEDLKRAPVRIAAAISSAKADAMRAAIDGGLVNAIATDSELALSLLGRMPPLSA
jgi:DNA-binding transcriptional regulator LsrR (DeoR family)